MKLNVYLAPAGKASFIGQIDVVSQQSNDNVTHNANTSGVETIVLLDISGSMGQNVRRVITQYIPDALSKVGYSDHDTIHLVTFASQSRHTIVTIPQLRASTQGCEGCTYMSPGVSMVSDIMLSSNSRRFRLLSISDGELHDTDATIKVSNELATRLQSRGNYLINSTAIRLFTSSSQPDTRGLSNLLRIGTQNTNNLIVDIQALNNPQMITDHFSELLCDSLGSSTKLTFKDDILMTSPWNPPSNEVYLTEGTNTFWLSEVPKEGSVLIVKDIKSRKCVEGVEVCQGSKLDFGSYNTVLKDKVEFFMQKLKILKVVNTAEAQEEINSIVSYFKQLEKCFAMNDPDVVDIINNRGLQSRLAFFRDMAKKKSRSISLKMGEIANDSKVNQMNSAQHANYLRSATTSLRAKNLAKRALRQGLDFDVVAIKEVREMKKHLHELSDIDDTDHYVSFYSQETTLSGIKAVCELDDEHGTLDDVSALEILQLLNIVGVPCRGPVGDFPDPKTYHLDEMMLGSFVSTSDILIVKDIGNVLRDPYLNKEILNVIPFFDDDRIQRFLMKYGKTLLEYTASLGMRNMILDIPHTYKYTIVGGLWNMARRLNDEKTSVNVDVFTKLVLTYKTAVDGIFDYVVPLIKDQSAEDKKKNLSYYISNNGTTNMISPMISVMEESFNGTSNRARFMPDILRALFSFEFYQVIRKFHRSADDKKERRAQMLNTLLGIDCSKYGTPLPQLYAVDSGADTIHHDEYHLDQSAFKHITDRVYWVDKITLLPDLIMNSFRGKEGQKCILESSPITNKDVEKSLGLDVDLDTFKLFCMVQSFLNDNKASRVDNDNHKMTIEDCGNTKRMHMMISDYIRRQYRADYQSRLAKQKQIERELLADELVSNMVSCISMDEFRRLFKDGLVRNNVSARVYDTYQLGFVALRDRLFDNSIKIPLRHQKLWCFVMGRDKNTDEIIWNKGNVLRMSMMTLEEKFNQVGLGDMWVELYPLYKAANIYMYRASDKANRHTHCNSKISYWAMGYKTVGDYFADIGPNEREEYLSIHTHCCGIWDSKLVKPA